MWKNTRMTVCKLFGVLKIWVFEEFEDIPQPPIQQQVYTPPVQQPPVQSQTPEQAREPMQPEVAQPPNTIPPAENITREEAKPEEKPKKEVVKPPVPINTFTG